MSRLEPKRIKMSLKLPWQKIWEAFASDIIYSKKDIVSELITEAIYKLGVNVEFFFDNESLESICPYNNSSILLTKIPLHIDPESCGLVSLEKPTLNDHAKLLHLWCMLGLETYFMNLSKKAPYQLLRYVTISYSTSELEVDCFSIKSFLRNRTLPLPEILYPNEPDNTHNILAHLPKNPGLWKETISLADLRKVTYERYDLIMDSKRQYVFLQHGDYFDIKFNDQNDRLKESKGLHYIQYLISNPHKNIHVVDLYYLINKFPYLDSNESYKGMSKEQLDAENLGSTLSNKITPETSIILDDRLKELESQLEIAKDFENADRIKEISEEIDEIRLSLKGKSIEPDNIEKSRKAVWVSIVRAMKSISKNCSQLESHLKIYLKTGTSCIYRPEPRIDWIV